MFEKFLQRIDSDGYPALLLLGIIGTVGLSGLMLLPIFVGSYVDDLGYAEDTAGLIASVNILGLTLMTLLVSLKAKHWPLPRVAGYGLAGMFFFDALSLFAESLYILMAARLLSGAAGGAVQSAVAAALARTQHPDRGFGIYIGLQFVLPASVFYLFPILVPGASFSSLMLLLLALEAIMLLLVPIFLLYSLSAKIAPLDELAGTVEWRMMLHPAALFSLVALVLYGSANAAIYAYCERIGASLGLSWEQSGSVLSLANVLAVFGAGLVVVLGQRFGHFKPLMAGVALQAIAMLALVIAPDPYTFRASIILWTVAWAFTWPYFPSMQSDLDQTGTIVVAGQFANLLGNALGPALAALFLSDSNYSPMILLTAGLFALSVVPMYFVRRRSI